MDWFVYLRRSHVEVLTSSDYGLWLYHYFIDIQFMTKFIQVTTCLHRLPGAGYFRNNTLPGSLASEGHYNTYSLKASFLLLLLEERIWVAQVRDHCTIDGCAWGDGSVGEQNWVRTCGTPMWPHRTVTSVMRVRHRQILGIGPSARVSFWVKERCPMYCFGMFRFTHQHRHL